MQPLAISLASLLLLIPLAACSSSSDDDAPPQTVQYLGLGNSIAYGENGFVPFTKEARPNGDAFVGYPDLIGREEFGGRYANLGCPGATTDSFLSLEGEDNGCREFQAQWLKTMHVPYTSAQADKADELLSRGDVQLVTLGIGGNDLLLTLSGCAKLTPDDPDASLACALGEVPKTIVKGAQNLTTILRRIRDTGFQGPLIYLNLYATSRNTDPAAAAVSAWNAAMQAVVTDAGGAVADAFSAFSNAASAADGDPCAAGLLIPNPDPNPDATPRCDVHPTAEGARLLAETVEGAPGFRR